MFKFNFIDEDLETTETEKQASLSSPHANQRPMGAENLTRSSEAGCMHKKHNNAKELTLDELAKSLPPALSYSPLVVPFTNKENLTQQPVSSTQQVDSYKPDEGIKVSGKSEKPDASLKSTAEPKHIRSSITLLRRDLYDARYQLISEATGDSDEASSSKGPEDSLDFVNNPSDLVPGVYEGGLKTWECSLDLIDCLSSMYPDPYWMKGKRIFEIGCGTAAPSLYLLRLLFSDLSTENSSQTEIVLQDYNDLVLRLVTFPNVLLTWYASPLAEAYRERRDPDEDPFDPSKAGDMSILPELLSEFQSSLESRRITIRFISGSWQSLTTDEQQTSLVLKYPFDVVLTSETIYNVKYLPTLINLLKLAMGKSNPREASSDTIAEKIDTKLTLKESGKSSESLCLVAAKVLYFGVGGSIRYFERSIERQGGKTDSVLQRKDGVGRTVLRLIWD